MMRRTIALLLVVVFWPGMIRAQESTSHWTWGVATGFPQTIAVTTERHGESPARLQLHAGTFIVASSAGARLVLVSPHAGFAPYAFFGAGLLHVAEGEGGGGTGLTGYGWAGAGLRIRTGALQWFVELGGMFGMNTGKGYESALPSGAMGVSFGR